MSRAPSDRAYRTESLTSLRASALVMPRLWRRWMSLPVQQTCTWWRGLPPAASIDRRMSSREQRLNVEKPAVVRDFAINWVASKSDGEEPG